MSADLGGEEAPPIVHDVLSSAGHPLDAATRAYMEPRLGQDFSHVRVHTDSRAADSARAINARAYTVGNHIAFATGRYQPGVRSGRELLAHELTHVVQQSGHVASAVPSAVLDADPSAEREADASSRMVVNEAPSRPVQRVPRGSVARQAEPEHEGPGILGTIGGGLMGEFNQDPSVSMIGVDLGVSLIPILDQASDVRDISAHLYYMTVHNQYNRVGRWVGLVFTLIGLIPEVGSVIKSASKLVIRGVREAVSHLDEIFRLVRRVLPEIGEVGQLQRYIAAHWDRWVAFGTNLFHQVLNRISTWMDSASLLTRHLAGTVLEALGHVRALAPRKLSDAYGWARNEIDSVLTQVRERLGRSGSETPAPTPVPPIAAASIGGSPPTSSTLSPIPGAEEVRFTQAEYESALGRVFPSQFLNRITRTVDEIGERAARDVCAEQRFIDAVTNRDWTLAGTLFHSAAARQSRALPVSALPPGWTIRAEEVIQAGKGGSRADILLRSPAGEIIEFDWKTTGRSALSWDSRQEMTRHAGQIATNIGGSLTTQESRSWMDFVRPLLRGLP